MIQIKYGKSLTQSLCPVCSELTVLLAPIDIINSSLPAFYLCFACRYIGQSGVGEIITVNEKLGLKENAN